MTARLNVNIDHVATIREARKTIEPSIITAAVMCEQAGANGTGISYQRTEAGYQLEGESEGIRVSFTSGESLTRLVGNSFEIIARRTR